MLILADISILFSMLTLQVYLPESADLTELSVFNDEYRVKDIISGRVADTIAVSFGPFHAMFTVTGSLTAEPNSTVQAKAKEDPDSMGLGESE